MLSVSFPVICILPGYLYPSQSPVSFPVTCVLPSRLAEIQGTFKAPHSQTIFLYRADLLSPENNLLRGESILKLRKLAFQALPPGCVALEESVSAPYRVC